MLVPLILTEEEYARVPEDIAKKIDDYIGTKAENFKRFKDFHDKTQAESEERVANLENIVSESQRDLTDTKKEAEVAQRKIEELQTNLKEVKNELDTLQELSKRLENENASLTRKQTAMVEEREDFLRRLERRDLEIERLHTDNKSLSEQLVTASAAKCEALAHVELIEGKEAQLQIRERYLEREKDILTERIRSLEETVERHAVDLSEARRDYTTRQISLEMQLNEANQKLQISEETIETQRKTIKDVQAKADNLVQRLKDSRDSEIKLQETFEQELSAQSRLADLYKKSAENAESKSEELISAVKELKTLLSESSQRYGELEERTTKEREVMEAKIQESKTAIELLKKELAEANELLKAAKREMTEEQLEMLSPSAAAASRLIKSGLSLTQIYSQYVAVSEELFLEKQQCKKLNVFLDAILTEIEERTPHLRLERENYQSAIASINYLSTRCDELVLETQQLRDDVAEARKASGHYSRENARLKTVAKDLSRQVCVLLKEVEETRGGFVAPGREDHVSSSEESSASQVISDHLVTFRGLEELQKKNMELLCSLRQLSEKQEEMERKESEFNLPLMKESLERATRQLEELKESEENSRKMMESLARQRDMYRVLYLQQFGGTESVREDGDGEPEDAPSITKNIPSSKDDQPSTPHGFKKVLQLKGATSTPIVAHSLVGAERSSQELNELKDKLKESENALKQLQEDYDSHCKETKITQMMMADEHTNLKKEISELRAQNSKYASLVEFTEERFKILQENTSSYRTQIEALEKKNQIYNTTIIKHEQAMMHLKDAAFAAQTKLSAAEVRIESLHTENKLLREAEARLMKERESWERERRGQTLLMTNLEAIRASLERTEGESKTRLEARIEDMRGEINMLRRQLDSERETVRDALAEAASLRGALESEKDAYKALEKEKIAEHEAVLESREEVQKLKARLEAMAAGTRGLTERGAQTSVMGSSGDPGQIRLLRDAQIRSKELEDEISSLRLQLSTSREHINQYSSIASDTEQRLIEVEAELQRHRNEAEKRNQEAAESEQTLRNRISDLEKELAASRDSATAEVGQLRVQLCRIQDELKSVLAELEEAKKQAAVAREDAASHAEVARQAEDKFARQVVLHSTDLQALKTLREELASIRTASEKLTLENSELSDSLSVDKKAWEEHERLLNVELEETRKRLGELETQNSLLHDQLEELGTRTAKLLADKEFKDPNSSLDSSVTDYGEQKTSEQLLQVVSYLRKERAIASSKLDVANAEKTRLQCRLHSVECQLEDARRILAEERERSETTILNSARQSELLRKVETLNALTDSNRALRLERDELQSKLREVTARQETLQEEVAPLQVKHRELQSKFDNIMLENQALRGEAARWRARANTLQERANRIAPEDLKRAQAERDNALKQLAQEREESAKKIGAERNRIEEEAAAASAQLAKVRSELRELQASLKSKDEEITRISEDLENREALLSDAKNKEIQIRKIAKNYKTKFEELSKSVEEEKKKAAELLNAPGGSGEPSQEVKERLKDEARKELELKMKDLDEKHAEQLKEASEVANTVQKELDSVKQEWESLKSTSSEKEERSKQMLKSARLKIIQLNDANTNLNQQLTELNQRVEAMEMNKEEGSSRFTALRSQYEGKIARLEKERSEEQREHAAEKERISRENEMLMQKVSLLQRALENKQGSKPSASSSDKVSSEPPPTANIKPMAGSSPVSTKPQQTQQSVTVAPSRATPFASIRPMSLPTRTAAVLPTAQAGSSTVSHGSQGPISIAPQLVQPQQMSAMMDAPTSGSIGPIRQATVQPTPAPSVPTIISVGPTLSRPDDQSLSHDDSHGMHSGSMEMDRPAVSVVMKVSESVAEGHDPSESMQPNPPLGISGLQSQVVAMVSPRQQQPVDGAVPGPSGLTPMGSVCGVKRSREIAVDGSDGVLVGASRKQMKRSRMVPAESGSSTSREEPEVREATSSQRPDHEEEEDEIIVVDSDEVEGVEEEAEEGLGEEEEEEGGQRNGEEDDDGVEEENEEEIGEVEGSQAYDDDGENGAGYLGGYDREEDQELGYEEGEMVDDGGRDGVSTMVEEQEAERRGETNDDVVFVDEPGMSSRERMGGGEVPDQSSGASVSHSSGSQVITVLSATSATVPSSPAVMVTPRLAPASAAPSSRSLHPVGRFQQQQHHHPQQQQLLLPPQSFDEGVDDSIVPSTPTLFVPRRTDGFGEAVSSPQVPTARFTFASTSDSQQPVAVAPVSITPSAARTGGLAQVASEGIDDTRMDLSQLEESGTGRSVPTTPLQVSPQGDAAPVEMSSEVTQTVSSQLEEQEQRREQQLAIGGHDGEGATSSSSLEAPSSTNRDEGCPNNSSNTSNIGIPSIRVTAAPAEESGEGQVEGGDDGMEEPGLPSSQSQISVEGDDQSREASGNETDDVTEVGDGSEGGVQEASSSGGDSTRGSWRGQQTARRSASVARRSTRGGFARRQTSVRPVPIVWSEPTSGATSREAVGSRGRGAAIHRGSPPETRGGPSTFRQSPHSRRMGRGKPKGSFPQYQMRY